jgi:hypothetical protein
MSVSTVLSGTCATQRASGGSSASGRSPVFRNPALPTSETVEPRLPSRCISGDTDVEYVAQPLVEEDLWRHPGIGTRQDRAVRALAGREHTLTRRRLVRPLVLLGDVMGIAGLELGEHGVGRRQRLLRAQRQETRGNERDRVSRSHGRYPLENTEKIASIRSLCSGRGRWLSPLASQVGEHISDALPAPQVGADQR